jgi:outer membrane protein assembly factor BamB
MRRAIPFVIGFMLVACSSGKPTATPSSSLPSTASSTPTKTGAPIVGDWPVYHHDNGRSGVSSDQTPLGHVRQAWTSARLDELVYAQPLVVGNQAIVATEGNTVYSLDATNGKVGWRKNLGTPVSGGSLPCGNISPTGITGTPAIDPAAGIIYVVAFLRSGPHHELFALNLSDGHVRWHRTIDPPGLSAVVEQERGAVALGNKRAYVPFGGLTGDCGPYKGAVVSSSISGTGGLQSYVVPTSREGGIWTPAGPGLDSSGNVWVTTGNTASTGAFDFGNAVIRFSSSLKVSDYFAPSNWAALNAGDVDLGSVGPVLLSDGRAFAAGKAGIAYLINRNNLGHIGGEITSRKVCSRAFGQPATQGSMVFVPCEGSLVAVRVGSKILSVQWTSSGGSGPAILAAGALWTLKRDGRLIALNPSTGNQLFSVSLGTPATRFISPSAAGGRLFVAEGNKIVAFTLH